MTSKCHGMCFTHDPCEAERRHEVRVMGGRNSSTVVRTERAITLSPGVGGVVEVIADTIQRVRDGSIQPAVGNSVASLSRAFIAAHEAALDLAKLRELEALLDTVMSQDQHQTRPSPDGS